MVSAISSNKLKKNIQQGAYCIGHIFTDTVDTGEKKENPNPHRTNISISSVIAIFYHLGLNQDHLHLPTMFYTKGRVSLFILSFLVYPILS